MHYILLGTGLFFLAIGLFMLVKSLLKIAIFVSILSIVVGSLFCKNRKKKKRSNLSYKTEFRNKKRLRKELFKYNKQSMRSHSSHDSKDDIDLDDDLLTFNKISSTSVNIYNEPWKYQWMIIGSKKDYGPYSFDEIIGYFKNRKINGSNQCYPSSGGDPISISSIIKKKAS